MEYIQYIFIGILLILFISIFIFLLKIYYQRKKYKEEYIQKKKSEYEKALTEEQHQLEKLQVARKSDEEIWKQQRIALNQAFCEREAEMTREIELIKTQKEAFKQSQQEQEETSKQYLDNFLATYYRQNQKEYESTLRAMQKSLQEAAQEEWQKYYNEHQQELEKLIQTINDYKKKQTAINEQILRQRAIDEQQDFYRICITDDDLSDITLLLNIKNQLHKSQLLDKIIYDTFVSKYVKEMAKRVLAGKDISGIYKVTNIQTQEIYIGKSTTVATRWQNHCKSAFGLEGVADSQFQRALKKYGVQSFTWELLEETPKDKLTEREKYYIQFYETTKYGYNQKIG